MPTPSELAQEAVWPHTVKLASSPCLENMTVLKRFRGHTRKRNLRDVDDNQAWRKLCEHPSVALYNKELGFLNVLLAEW